MNSASSPAPSLQLTGNKFLGYLCGLGFITVWTGFIVVSRLGVKGDLTPYDITALRFMVGSLVTLPFVYLYWPRHLPLGKILILAATGPGTIYSVLMYIGLEHSPAAFAGVFANGSIPIFTAMFAWVLLGDRLSSNAFFAIAVILTGSIAVGYEAMHVAGSSNLSGLPFLIASSFVLAAYMVFIRMWKVTAKQTLAIINLPNTLIFLPVWYFMLPSGLASAGIGEIMLQALYQGLGPGFMALIFFTYAIQALGATPVAGFAATVPATAALLAIPVLGETLNFIEWVGVLTVTLGLALLLLRR